MTSGSFTVYRSCKPVVNSRYVAESDRTPVEAIIDAVAEAANVDATALPPLYEVVDTDALNQLFNCHNGAIDAESIFSFEFDSWSVFVRADGRIQVCDATTSTDPAPVFAAVTS